jgi:flagellar protein FliO/FliZ
VEFDYPRFLLALIFVIGLIGLLTLLARRFGFGAIRLSPGFMGKGRNGKSRISIVEATSIDARRRLVLIRRDDTEHLILIGANGELVVERNIQHTASAETSGPASPPASVKDGHCE